MTDEKRHDDHPTDPIKRWPFAETPGNFAHRLLHALDYRASEVALLAAVRYVLIENPPALAAWLDPGAAAADAAAYNLLVIALRHSFPTFQNEAPITTEAILALGKEYNRMALGMPSTPERKIITVYVNPPIPWRHMDWTAYYDGDEPDDDGNMLCGTGATAAEAIANLRMTVEDNQDALSAPAAKPKHELWCAFPPMRCNCPASQHASDCSTKCRKQDLHKHPCDCDKSNTP